MASWEIFCSVVDNYGDIGVTWRLARQLAAEHGQAVRLWVDEPQAFARICPRPTRWRTCSAWMGSKCVPGADRGHRWRPPMW